MLIEIRLGPGRIPSPKKIGLKVKKSANTQRTAFLNRVRIVKASQAKFEELSQGVPQ